MPPSPVHILGLGNLGKLLAHSLRKQHPQLPITLLFHRPSLLDEWKRAGQGIEIVRAGVCERQSGFGYEEIGGGGVGGGGRIEQLIVATKTHATVGALGSVRQRVGAGSTVLFLQNGMGTIDEVNTHVFPDETSRPNYLAGIFNHGVYATSTFSSVHAGIADAVIGPVVSSSPSLPCSTENGRPDTSTSTSTSTSPSTLAHLISSCPNLSTTLIPASALLPAQVQKLTINAVINPLSLLFGCKNGKLFSDPAIVPLIDRLLVEISNIVLAILADQAPPRPTTPTTVPTTPTTATTTPTTATTTPTTVTTTPTTVPTTPTQLRTLVYAVGAKTAENTSSMRQDRVAGRVTEIDYINGYLVGQARRLGVPSRLNERIVGLVKEGGTVGVEEIGGVFGV